MFLIVEKTFFKFCTVNPDSNQYISEAAFFFFNCCYCLITPFLYFRGFNLLFIVLTNQLYPREGFMINLSCMFPFLIIL